jgi:uroporphyrinogen decarboxylase
MKILYLCTLCVCGEKSILSQVEVMKNNSITGKEKLARLIAEPSSPVLIRGELFVTPKVLAEVGFDQTPAGVVDFASSINADICFYNWTDSSNLSDFHEMMELCHKANLGFGLTIDGPFERLAQTGDLFSLLPEIGTNASALKSRIADKVEEFERDLRAIGTFQEGPILICEDIAYDRGLYFSPTIFRESLLPVYQRVITDPSFGGSLWGWHSDGNLSAILPDLVTLGIRFFSLETECVDLPKFKRNYLDQVTLVAGLRTAWLVEEDWEHEEEFPGIEEIRSLLNEGGFILSSTCGIYDAHSLQQLEKIYHALEATSGPFHERPVP